MNDKMSTLPRALNSLFRHEPPQPSARPFLAQLQRPLHRTPIRWLKRNPTPGEISLARGLVLEERFPDPHNRLPTAYADFRSFMACAAIRANGPCRLSIAEDKGLPAEAFRISAGAGSCALAAADTEGVRRGLVFLEDEMLRRGGPFLPRGALARQPLVKTRISRHYDLFKPCGLNYFPDPYLNRLAHHGVNGLWHRIEFSTICSTRIIPEYGRNAERHQAALRSLTERYIRFGIRLYAFGIEPAAFAVNSPVLAAHPELAGHQSDQYIAFCTSTRTGQAYLEEALRNLFTAVPLLGGLIVITSGERPTYCCSMMENSNCPRCGRRAPQAVLADAMAAMARGAHAANPAAEIISWPYGQYLCWGEDATRRAAAQMPKGVILMQNFESAGRQTQLGKTRRADDYWLSYIGPSKIYRDCARAAQRRGTRMFAKLQVGCSHEVASVPHVPVPGNLYRKYRAIRDLNVTGVMQCWGSGEYPSLMTRAAGALSFAPMPRTEGDFLRELARRDWGKHAQTVVTAWRWFQRAYHHFPLTQVFGYYGPMHDGPVWPLYIIPRNLHLPQNWQVDRGWKGDLIGDCLGYHTLAEAIRLCRRMLALWQKGVRQLAPLHNCYRHDQDRMHDIETVQALELQFRSGLNILHFYAWREALIRNPRRYAAILERMQQVIRDELAIDRQMLILALMYPRLGFNAEAEGYKYFPAKIRWRMRELKRLVRLEFPAVERALAHGEDIFGHYTGTRPLGRVYFCARIAAASVLGRPLAARWQGITPTGEFTCWGSGAAPARTTRWRACHDNKHLYFFIECAEPDMDSLRAAIPDKGIVGDDDCVRVFLKTDPFLPGHMFEVTPKPARRYLRMSGVLGCTDPLSERKDLYAWEVAARRYRRGWSVQLAIPFVAVELRRQRGIQRLRVNVGRKAGTVGKRECTSWMPTPPHKDDSDPADWGWLMIMP